MVWYEAYCKKIPDVENFIDLNNFYQKHLSTDNLPNINYDGRTSKHSNVSVILCSFCYSCFIGFHVEYMKYFKKRATTEVAYG